MATGCGEWMRCLRMKHYLISFPSSAMSHIAEDDFPAVSEAAHAVIREAKAAGVYVFGGGIDETVAPVMVAADTSTMTTCMAVKLTPANSKSTFGNSAGKVR